MKRRLILWILLAMCMPMAFARQELRLPNFFAPHMVLQRDVPVPVWGWGEPGETVEITLGKHKAKCKVDAQGKWRVRLPRMKAGGPYTLEVSYKGGEEPREIDDVLVGDVFLCSGQSNMELPIRRCMDVVADTIRNYANTEIRYLKLPHQYNYVRPNDDVATLGWQDITPQNCGNVSAICYFMARELQAQQGIPIGLINAAVGGTEVQAWMPRETLQSIPAYAHEFDHPKYHNEDWATEVMRHEHSLTAEWNKELVAGDTVQNRWRNPDYTFAHWPKVSLFEDWDQGRHGSFWFTKCITLPDRVEGKDALLRLGAMKDADSVFVNGTYVGNTTYEYPPRNYTVPAGLLKKGENRIVVHLTAQSGKASFTPGKTYQLQVGSQCFPLDGPWQYAVGKEMTPCPESTYWVNCPSGLYNAMIAPLRDFPIRAVLWYQGESNIEHTDGYDMLLAEMVKAWRSQFNTQFPVAILQLPAYMQRHDLPYESGWTHIREHQMRAVQRIPKSIPVPLLDTGEWNDIHPQDKITAGHRAALAMRKLVYRQPVLSHGPLPVKAKRVGEDIVVSFSRKTGNLRPFASDQVEIINSHQLRIKQLTNSLFYVHANRLRYAWDDFPSCVLFSEDGLPSPQFEIDLE